MIYHKMTFQSIQILCINEAHFNDNIIRILWLYDQTTMKKNYHNTLNCSLYPLKFSGHSFPLYLDSGWKFAACAVVCPVQK